MEIVIYSDSDVEEMKINIYCRKLTPELERVVAVLKMLEQKLTGIYEGETCFLDPDKVLYIDTADKKTFLYTTDKVYETALKLYELEEQLRPWDFIRVSKSAVVNFARVRSLRPDFGGRMRLSMSNGEVVVANRQYVPAIKAKLGM